MLHKPEPGERVVMGGVSVIAAKMPHTLCEGCHFELEDCQPIRAEAGIRCGSQVVFLTEATFALKRLKGEV